MGFISFNETYYRQRLEALESKALTRDDIYEAQQLLKVLDDLADEGYFTLNDRMESDFSCLSRLRAVIRSAGAAPIPLEHDRLEETAYSAQEFELRELLDGMITEAGKAVRSTDSPFLKDIYAYCKWIGYEEDTAYVFLLRDALLPYMYFKSRHCERAYPWLISRRFLEDIAEVDNVDDDIRLPIYEALESGCRAYGDFCAFCKDGMLRALERHSELKQVLCGLLRSIKEKNIVVVESGYAGTIPMMLKALDDRVSFKLYTTAPFLYDTYKDVIFCRRYEDIRKFETVYSQDMLLRYSSYRDGKFYVNLSDDATVRNRSFEEIRYFMG